MRIVWKDSKGSRTRKPITYRGITISPYQAGWITDMPDDKNIYKNYYCAENAIDERLGAEGRKFEDVPRLRYGVQVIGQVEEETIA